MCYLNLDIDVQILTYVFNCRHV